MEKVFIVTSGLYSDYGINAVFSSRELADNYINGDEDYRIEEYDIDTKEKNEKYIKVEMDINGNTKDVEEFYSTDDSYSDRVCFIFNYNLDKGIRYDKINQLLCYYSLNNDKTTAIKACNELRAQLIALQIWGCDEKLNLYLKRK